MRELPMFSALVRASNGPVATTVVSQERHGSNFRRLERSWRTWPYGTPPHMMGCPCPTVVR